MTKKKRYVIEVTEDTKERLYDYGIFGETFNQIIIALMNNWDKTHNGEVRGIKRKK